MASSPRARATTPAACTKGGAQVLLYSISLPMSPSIAGGTTIQPRRHPVMRQALEKELQLMTRSSGVAMSRKDGAHGASKLMRW
ncbi:hypothetical protein D9M68_630430 [compost metagenome]